MPTTRSKKRAQKCKAVRLIATKRRSSSNSQTPAQQGAAPDRLQPALCLVPRLRSGFRRRVSLFVVPSRDTWLRFILSGDEPKRRRNRAALPAKSRECCFQATAWTQTLSGLSGSARQKCSSHKVGQKLYFVPSSYLAHKALCQMFGVDYMGEQKSGSLPIM